MAPFAGYDDMDACKQDHSEKDDPGAYCAQIYYEVTGEWPAEKQQDVISMPIEVAELAVERNDLPKGTWGQIPSDNLEPFRKLAVSVNDARRFKRAIDMVKLSRSDDVSEVLSKADSVEKVDFDAQIDRSVSMVFKKDDEFLIWGPASVEVVDKEKDKVSVEALDKALPQLLKRASLSYAHTDQIVGRILERFETEDPVEVTVNGETYERDSFPTAVLDLDDGSPPGMFVAGEVFNDTNQSQSVRQKIEEGEIDSYSISGEALVTQKQIEGDMVYDDILEMDLSAVTLCEEGMNQDAKFARVNGEVSEVERAEVEAKSDPEFEVDDGPVSSPDQVEATAVAKSMTKKSEAEEKEDSVPSDFNPDAYLKREEFEGEIATKEDLNNTLEETVEKTVEAVVEKVGEAIPTEEDIEEKARDSVADHFPEGDIATVGYIQENFAQKGGDYEEAEEEDEEEADEEEPEGKAPEEDSLTREQLKEDLPSDVWDVVSEYVGDTKQKSEDEESPEPNQADQLEKAVEDILEGKEISSPGVDVSERASEADEMFKDDGEEVEAESSPALNKWR